MNYNHLNLGISEVLADKITLHKGIKDPKNHQAWHWELSADDLHEDFVKIVDRLGLTVDSVWIFKTNHFNKKWPIHRDNRLHGVSLENHTDYPKLNWIYGDNSSYMIWYALKNNVKLSTRTDLQDDASYFHYEDEDMVEIERTIIKQTAIVQSGVPHSVLNTSDKNRWCVSIIFTKDNRHIGMEELVNLFNDYCIIVH